MTGKFLTRYPLTRLLSAPQFDEWLVAGQDFDCASGVTIFQLQSQKPVWKNLKNWLRLHTLLHFCRERAFLGFMAACTLASPVSRHCWEYRCTG